MLLTFITWIHVAVALTLIFFVLLQDPKGGGAFGVFGGGGGSNSLFGSTGAGNFFTKVTKGAAILFAVLCIAMTYVISHPVESVLDKTAPAAATAPAAEQAPAAAQPETAPQGGSPHQQPAESK